MKKYFILVLASLLFASCKFEVRKFDYNRIEYHDPYDARHHQLKSDVSHVREFEHNAKAEARLILSGDVIATREYRFDPDGKILWLRDTTFHADPTQNITYSEDYYYSRIGKLKRRTLKTRTSDRKLVYKPKFTYTGNAKFDLMTENSTFRNPEDDSKVDYYARLDFTVDGMLQSRSVSMDSKKFIESVYTYNDQLSLVESVTTNFNTNRKTTNKYNEQGNLASETVAEAESGRTISTFTYTYGDFDDAGNWITRTKYDNRHQPVSVTHREISYFSDMTDAPQFYQLNDASNIGDYFRNLFIRLTANKQNDASPSKLLTIIALVLTLSLSVYLIFLWNYYREYNSIDFFDFEWDTLVKSGLFEDFWGTTLGNGMKRIWVYNKEPYAKVASLLLMFVGGFIASLVVLLVLGAVVWLLFGIMMVLFNILNFGLVKWLLVICAGFGLWSLGWGTIGTIFAKLIEPKNIIIIGASILAYIFIPFVPSWIFLLVTLYFIFFNGYELIGMIIGFILCWVLMAFGIAAISDKMWLEGLGHSTVATGFEFLHSVNLFRWAYHLFSNYWDVVVLCFITPVILFLFIAATIILFNSLLIGFEWAVMRIYSVRRPCPVCGSTNEPRYISKNSKPNQQHPVGLHPGVYGAFRHKSPFNSDKLPTMLLNGKWKLHRVCANPNCKDKLTTSDVSGKIDVVGMGTELHIGVVGHRSSGKSYLLYGGLGLLQQLYPDRFNQIDKNRETDIDAKKARIDKKQGIQTNAEDWYRAIQMIYKAPARMMPYHLFYYDVAGEKFDADKRSQLTGLDFYRNVQSIVFVVDVAAIDLSGVPANDDIVEWIENQNIDEKHDIVNTLSVLVDILKTKVGRKTKDIDFNLVCVKKDMGYFEAVDYDSNTVTPKEIEKFVCNDLGLNSLVGSAKVEFKSVNFHAVSVVTKDVSSLKNLFFKVLKQQGVRV